MNYPRLTNIKAQDDYTLVLTFGVSENRIFDVSPYIKGEWYGMLADLAYFKAARLVGRTVEWPDGQDLAPHELYENSNTGGL